MIYKSALDKIKEMQGIEELKSRYQRELLRNKPNAIKLVNETGLTFSTFFLLIPLLKKYNVYPSLYLKRKIAMALYNKSFSEGGTQHQ